MSIGRAVIEKTCGAKTRKGKTCGKQAGWGTDHVGYGRCKLHGGSTENGKKNAAMLMGNHLAQTYGGPRQIDPHTALLEELHRTAGHVAWLQQQVAELEEDDITGPVGQEGMTEAGTTHHPRFEPHVLIRMYHDEREHMAKVASACLKAGIEERRVRLAEEQGQMIAQVLTAVLSDLKVPIEKARPVVRKHLTAIAGTAEEVA